MGIGKTTWWNGVKTGRYPRQIKLGPRTSAWRVEDIRALIASFAASDSSQDALHQKKKGDENE
jgi:predicted DNA-binding transcriptional regulator AlpA